MSSATRSRCSTSISRSSRASSGPAHEDAPRLLRFRRRDYLGPRAIPLDRAVRDAVEGRTGSRPEGPIRLLTQLRSFGHYFNPVTFYYCLDARGDGVEAVVAEVTNTPWGERHAYVLPGGRADHPKLLHVSPFMAMDHEYSCRATPPRSGWQSISRAAGTARSPSTPPSPCAGASSHAVRPDARGSLPARKRKGARADLRSCARPQTRGRPGPPPSEGERGVIDRAARWILSLFLRRIRTGTLTIIEEGARRVYGSGPPAATIHVRSARMWRMGLVGSRGLAEAYAQGLWDSPDLAALVSLGARNAAGLDRLRGLLAPVRVPIQRIRAVVRRSTRERSRRDIAAHYDLGNELFSLMLDQTMSYSCAVFGTRAATLEDAQLAKLELICDKLELRPERPPARDRHRLGRPRDPRRATRGCRVTTTTISREQHDHASPRSGAPASSTSSPSARGLPRPAGPLRQARLDRDDRGRRLAPIGASSPVLGAACRRRRDAAPAITIDDRAYEVEKASRSFINTHIFPGGCLPSLEVLARSVARHTDMQAVRLEDLTPHYVETLRRWQRNFAGNAEALAALGYDRRFQRLWTLYLNYCEAGFAEQPHLRHPAGVRETPALSCGICRFDRIARAVSPMSGRRGSDHGQATVSPGGCVPAEER